MTSICCQGPPRKTLRVSTSWEITDMSCTLIFMFYPDADE